MELGHILQTGTAYCGVGGYESNHVLYMGDVGPKLEKSAFSLYLHMYATHRAYFVIDWCIVTI